MGDDGGGQSPAVVGAVSGPSFTHCQWLSADNRQCRQPIRWA